MGDLAEDIMNGQSCSGCNVYFEDEHGYPVLCPDCWEDWTPKQREAAGVQKAMLKEL